MRDSVQKTRRKIPVNVQLNTVSATRKSLVVTLDAAEVTAEHTAVVAEIVKVARLPGFRPGKAPVAVVTRQFGKQIREEFNQKVLARAYREGLEKEKLDVLNVVNVEEGTVAAGQPATITVTVDVRPEFALPAYAGLPTEIAPVDATDAEVDSVVEGMRNERADFKAAARPAQKGDYVKLGYEGNIDGKPIAELVPDKQLYGKVPQTWEEVDGTANAGVIPGLGQQLAGVAAGDKKSVNVTFPADFAPVPALAGKAAVYAVDVQEIRERVLPAIDEEFLKAHQADSLDALKTNIRNNLKLQKEGQNRAAQRRQVTDALAAQLNFEAPESLVASETQGVLRNFIEENMRRGVPQEQFEKDKKELFEGARKAAANRIRLQLVLAKIAEQEKITVDESDIDAWLYRESMRSQQKPEKLMKQLSTDQNMLRQVQQNIIFDKAVDLLVAKATVTTVQPKAV
ncbi:MAG: hypothetical protein RLZZ15_1248 [Verrucomicrobiota bacterium]